MQLDRLLNTGKPMISFEFFPPKTDEGFTALYQTIEELRPLQPSYISVTYGAGGSTRSKTLDLAAKVQNEIGFNTVAHLTCVGHTADEIGQILDQLWASGVKNILALRGDPPVGGNWTKTPGGFDYAAQLIKFVKNRHDFFVACAGFPEGHPQCINPQRDLEHLKSKIDAGAQAIVTQLFFDNNDFHRFRDNCDRLGIRVPIIAGIMPISNVAQIKRFVTMCGAKIPMPLLRKLERIESDPDAVYQAGIDYATNQCRDLLFHDVAGLQFYTLNKSKATTHIVQNLSAVHA
ncbi:MAG TPA: methylenetetrahydrofolate reductase [NAD(P)H] [Tepidisphaeraceae bacterium]